MNKPQLNALLASTAVATVLLSPVSATAAVEMFLKIDTVQGESIDKTHKGEIDVLAWSWGESRPVQATTGGGAGTGKGVACISDLSITKYIDEATPKLITSTVNNDTFAKAQLSVRKAGAPSKDYFTVAMENVTITSYTTGGSGGEDRLTENITLHFNKAQGQYVQQSPSGVWLDPVTWTVSENGGRGNPACP